MWTKLKLALLISAPLAAGATTYAAAQGDAPAHAGWRQTFDANGDGTLDDAERAQRKAAFAARRAEHRQAMLARYDANHDGALDQAEHQAMRDDKLARRFQAMDKDGDGRLSLDEFKAGAARPGLHRHGRRGHGRTHGGGMKR